MDESTYTRFDREKLILRDELAIDRTLLSNERTLMAYLRSGVALIIAGVTMINFSETTWFWMAGLLCLPAGLCTGLLGIVRFRKMNHAINAIRKHSTDRDQSAAYKT